MHAVVVGSGISGCMTALCLLEHGCEVTLISKGPDPRVTRDAEHYSSTFNGESGRFITAFEGHPYTGSSLMYPNMVDAFRMPVSQGGWLGKQVADFAARDRVWLSRRYEANFDEWRRHEGFEYYVRNNLAAMDLWDELAASAPHLFAGADFYNKGILRLYDNFELFDWAVKAHRRENVVQRVLSAEDVRKAYPAFAEACDTGAVAGGLEARGMTLNIKRFMSNLLDHLEHSGVKFRWDTRLMAIERDADKSVTALSTSAGSIQADCYTLHLGAYADDDVLRGTASASAVSGVAGRWVLFPRPEGLSRPVKIHGRARVENGRRYPLVDVNLTPFTNTSTSEPYIALGGGYACVGTPPFEGIDDELQEIDAENERILQRFLGPCYHEACKNGSLHRSKKTCVRSFTHDDYPLHEEIACKGGGVLVIKGGTNTGTATLAPVIAREVLNSFLQIGSESDDLCLVSQ